MSYEQEKDNLIDELNNGEITQKEFNKSMSDLDQKFKEEPEECLDEVRQDFYDNY